MSVQSVRKQYREQLENRGRAYLNAKYPSEFELYVIALELVDSNLKTVRSFIFPVNPSNYEENQTFGSIVKKTLGGVAIFTTTTFIPTDLSLSGTFGHSFKALLGTDYTEITTSFIDGEELQVTTLEGDAYEPFDPKVKTGYGCYKILEWMVSKSHQLDSDGKPYILIFHNLAIGNSYVVKAMSLRPSMTLETNTLWHYSLSLQAVAYLSSVMLPDEQRERLQLDPNGKLLALNVTKSFLEESKNTV